MVLGKIVTLGEVVWDIVEISPDGYSSFTIYRSTPAAALAYTGYGAMGPLPAKDELERFMSGG